MLTTFAVCSGSNWAITDRQELIDIVEVVYRGASKGRGLVISPKGKSHRFYSHQRRQMKEEGRTWTDTRIAVSFFVKHRLLDKATILACS